MCYRVWNIDMDELNIRQPSPDEKKRQLFLNQKRTLDLFLERGAISKAQYDKSLGDLVRLMGMEDLIK